MAKYKKKILSPTEQAVEKGLRWKEPVDNCQLLAKDAVERNACTIRYCASVFIFVNGNWVHHLGRFLTDPCCHRCQYRHTIAKIAWG